MNDKAVTKDFKITAPPGVMRRFERFLAMLHFSSQWGHSGTFAMGLDGDGPERLTVSPAPNSFRDQYSLTSGIGGDIEIATSRGYTVCKMAKMGSEWLVRPSATLYRDGDVHSTAPRKLGDD